MKHNATNETKGETFMYQVSRISHSDMYYVHTTGHQDKPVWDSLSYKEKAINYAKRLNKNYKNSKRIPIFAGTYDGKVLAVSQ